MAIQLFRVKEGFSINGEIEIIYGSADPSASSGVAAPVGSTYHRTNGELWHKTAVSDTSWTKFMDSAGASLEDGYQNGYMGKTGNGSETPVYTQENHVEDGDTLVQAIDELDIYIGSDATPLVRTNSPIGISTQGHGHFGLSVNPTATLSIASQTYNVLVSVDGQTAQNIAIAVTQNVTTYNQVKAIIDAALLVGTWGFKGATCSWTGSGSTQDIIITSTLRGSESTIAISAGASNDFLAALSLTPSATAGSNAGTINSNIAALDAAIGTDAEITSTVIVKAANTINENLSALDEELEARNPFKIQQNNIAASESYSVDIDSLALTAVISVLWKVTVRTNSPTTNIYSCMINCITDGTNVEYDEFATLTLGNDITGLTITPIASAPNLILRISTTSAAFDVRVERIKQDTVI